MDGNSIQNIAGTLNMESPPWREAGSGRGSVGAVSGGREMGQGGAGDCDCEWPGLGACGHPPHDHGTNTIWSMGDGCREAGRTGTSGPIWRSFRDQLAQFREVLEADWSGWSGAGETAIPYGQGIALASYLDTWI